ncbi:MAG: hypothetical protein NVS3B20_02010 [Polyangiales bacterium]
MSDTASKGLLGRIEIADIDHIGLHGIHFGRLTIRDPQGRPVVVSYAPSIRFDAAGIVSAFLGKRTPTIDSITVDRVDVSLIDDGHGAPSIGSAFTPREALKPGPPKSASNTRLAIHQIGIKTTTVTGTLGNTPISAVGEVAGVDVLLEPEATHIDIPHVVVAHGPVPGYFPVPTMMEMSASLRIPNVTDPKYIGVEVRQLSVRADVGGAKLSVHGGLQHGSVFATVDAPQITPSQLSALLGGRPVITEPASVAIRVTGTTDWINVDVASAVGFGRASVSGHVDLAALASRSTNTETRIDLADATLRVTNINPAVFVPSAPRTLVSADVSAKITSTKEGTEIALRGERRFDDSEAENPFVDRAHPDRSAISATRISLQALALLGPHSIKADSDIEVELDQNRAQLHLGFHQSDATATVGKRADATVSVKGSVPSFSKFRIAKIPFFGAADVEAEAKADLMAATFAAAGQARAHGVKSPDFDVPSAVVDFSARGTFDNPTFEAKLTTPRIGLPLGKGEQTETPELRNLVAHVLGNKQSIGFDTSFVTSKDQQVSLNTYFLPTPSGAQIRDLHGHLKSKLFEADLAIRQLAAANGTLSIKGFRLASTAGGLRIDGAINPRRHEIDVDLASTKLNLPALGLGLGVADLTKLIAAQGIGSATLSISAKLKTLPASSRKLENVAAIDDRGLLHVTIDDARDASAHTASLTKAHAQAMGQDPVISGRVKIDLDGSSTKFGDFGAHADVAIDDRFIDADLALKLKDIIDASVEGSGVLAGRYDRGESWRDAVGHVDLTVGDVRLEKVRDLLTKLQQGPSEGPKAPPLPELSGTLSLNGHFERSAAQQPPTGFLAIATKKLAVQTDAFALEGVDFDVKAELARSSADGAKTDTRVASVVASARDKLGNFITADASVEQAWSKLVELAADHSKSLALEVPVTAHVVIPPRAWKKLPPIIASKAPIDGTLSLDAKLEGTLAKPKLEVVGTLDEMHLLEGQRHTFGLQVTYDGRVLKGEARVTKKGEPNGARLLDVTSLVTMNSSDLLEPSTGKELPWTAKLDAKVDGLPIGALSGMSELSVAGMVSGEVHVDHFNDPAVKAPSVKGTLGIDSLTLGDVTFDQTKVDLVVDGRHVDGRVVLAGQSGNLDAHLDAPLHWQNARTPSLDASSPVNVAVDAKGLRLKFLAPFVSALDEVDGYLDADVKGAFAQNKGGGSFTGAPIGTIRLRDGVVNVAAIGERYDGVSANVSIAKGAVTLQDLTLPGRSGDAHVKGSLALDGLVPKKFHAEFDSKRFPFSSQGVSIGQLSGTVKVDGDMKKDETDVTVVIDPMTLDLTLESGKHPQGLDDDPSIRPLEPIGPPEKTKSSTPGQTLKVAIKMPNNVWIRRDDLRVAVQGDPTIEVKEVARFGGEIRVEGGSGKESYAEVMGKRFYFDHANMKFDGSTDLNPVLDILINWEAPDGSQVKIAVSGRSNAPKIKLMSDPPGTQAEIMSLLVLGRRDAGSASQQRQAQSGAAQQTAAIVQGMTGAIIGKQLQKALPTSMSLSFQPGDQGFSNARYAGGYQYKNVYFELGYNAGANNKDSNTAGQTQPRTTFGVDWRFKPKWSLMTTLGDTGSALVDLLWHYRY